MDIKIINKNYFLIVLFAFVLFGKSVNSHPPKCPNTSIPRDLGNPAVLKNLQSKFLNSIWSSNQVVPQTPLSIILKDVLDLMINSDSRKFRTIAFLHTFRMATSLTVPIESSNFCLYARTVNSSVILGQGTDLVLGAQTLKSLADVVKNKIPLMSKASLIQAGCTNFPTVNVATETCFDNGLTYDMDGLWNIYGKLLPHTLKDILFRMYESSNVIDRAHAALVAAAIPDIGQELFDVHPPGPLLENFAILTTGPVPAECCAELRQKTDKLDELHNTLVQKNSCKIIAEKYSVKPTRKPVQRPHHKKRN